MKKLFLLSFFVSVSLSTFADTLCTIVCSPCDNVPNTLIKGAATDEQISAAQERMMKECGD